ncbi:nitrogenase stabilizing/protective protein NifW [Methylococcus capsulatus]|uniref:nitrogenase stabilizing/protective protein NifW n=1 Tax=Methylococcus capsulatus TaxID=414 RepID=UPI001C52B633|nr:nitrogenase stabilizing/protective protein NifW [Methylococcus capsulatus]QXP86264.1 nitrogenase stabilizing/protective protein NifW [Methylococcus capsulatus]QXP94065.1 nitrogenase stabilizing/protective protein NifW [Methylococcus capsulatus]UQN11198.1 nitrogenase stabilizing/protective protein NifW [Methylococcus capsulatus]
MNPVLQRLQSFSAAEEFLDFFGVEYEPSVVHVNRLHILKRFNQYLNRSPVPDDMDEATAMATCKALLKQAHDDFVKSTAAQEKVFKVFQDQDGKSISLDSLKASLATRGQRA